MEISHAFTVNLPVEDAWKVLTDLERVAPCLPGAVLSGIDDGTYQGSVKIKVGPVSARYQGTARFVEKNDGSFRSVIRAEGKDAGGQGTAAATVTMSLAEQGSGTKVDVRADLALSGRVAQFGRGVIADVTAKLIGQFVQRLEAEFAPGAVVADGPGAAPTVRGAKPLEADDVEPLDVMGDLGGLIAKRAVPLLGGLTALVVGFLLLRKGNPRPGTVPLVINLSFPAPVGRFSEEEATR